MPSNQNPIITSYLLTNLTDAQRVQALERLQELLDLGIDKPTRVSVLQQWGFLPTPSSHECACCGSTRDQQLVIWRPVPMPLLLVSYRELEQGNPDVPLNQRLREAEHALHPLSLKEALNAPEFPLPTLVTEALVGTLILCDICYAHVTRQAPATMGRHPVGVARKHKHDQEVSSLIISYLERCNSARVVPTYDAIAQYVHTHGALTITGKPYTNATIFRLMSSLGIRREAYCRVHEWGTIVPETLPTYESLSPLSMPLPMEEEEEVPA